MIRPVRRRFRGLDLAAAQRPHLMLTNSAHSAAKILELDGRHAEVLPPPVQGRPAATAQGDYFLVVSRLLPYKRVDLVIEAARRLGARLVVGRGPERRRLEELAGPGVEFRVDVPQAELDDLYARCLAVVVGGEEDLGLVPVEANSAGRPAVAFARGGALETAVDGRTGILFDHARVDDVAAAMTAAADRTWDGAALQRHAANWSPDAFADDVSVLVPAAVPNAPRSPQQVQAGVVGALIGLLVGFALVLVRQQLDDPVHGLEGLEEVLVAPVLTVIPRIRGRRKREGGALRKASSSPAAEAYRILRANLAAAGPGTQHRVLLVTSAMEEEGKSTTAANLAIAFAETGEQVVLVDADLRKPKLHRLLGVANERGLAEALAANPTRTASIVPIDTPAGRLGLLPAGPGREEPARTLSSPRLGSMLTGLRDSAIVIVDSPPALPVADATMLAGHADAVLLAVDTARSSRAALERLSSRLTATGTPVIGFVLHAAGPEHGDYQGYRGYRGYQAAEQTAAATRRGNRHSERRSAAPRSWTS